MTIQTLGLVGASTMATGIAQTAAMGDLKAILFDASEEVLHTPMHLLGKRIDKQVSAGNVDQPGRDAPAASVRTTTDWAEPSAADAMVEAAAENKGLKTEILKRSMQRCVPVQ